MGGSRASNCSVLEAIQICEKITGKKMKISYLDDHRIGDHIWWISDVSKFKTDFPKWEIKKNIETILAEMNDFFISRKK